MIFHVRLGFGRGADAETFDNKVILFIECARHFICDMRVQPHVFRQNFARFHEQRLPNPLTVMRGVNVQAVD